MNRGGFLLPILLLVSFRGHAQCSNSPVLSLSNINGIACGTNPVTIAGNTFGGSATSVTISENGAGSVSPAKSSSSPFEFTYSPKNGDMGKKILITVTTNNPLGFPCSAASVTYTLAINPIPGAPVVGIITQPTCNLSTGSVKLSGLPSSGIWSIIRSPGGILTTGTGTTSTISDLSEGTFSFTVKNSDGCTSSSTSNITINRQPAIPASPVQSVDCTLGSGFAGVTVTSPVGTGLQYRLDGGAYQIGLSFSNVANGNHTITVRNSSGCTTTGAGFVVSCSCVNSPTVTLSNTAGSVCGIIPVTISGNTFGGNATGVTITENGAGTVSPSTSGMQPFSFTYNPAAADVGKTVSITVTTIIPPGLLCVPATAVYVLSVFDTPAAPVVASVIQPTCADATGSVLLNGLPPAGSWTLIQSPGNAIAMGSGTSTSVLNLSEGIYSYTVTNAAGCKSPASENAVILANPSTPSPPGIGIITPPTCSLSTGSVVLNGLPLSGSWTLTRYPGTVKSTGTGTSIAISGLSGNVYNFLVTNSSGCVSLLSANVVIPPQPVTPSPPLVGSVIQPVYDLPTGSVVLLGLPDNETWKLTRNPGAVITTGTGISKTIAGLEPQTYTFTVTNSAGCTSGTSAGIVINQPSAAPLLIITNPLPVCSPETVDITTPEVTAGSDVDLILTYWIDPAAEVQYLTPETAAPGVYYIRGTSPAGSFSVKQVIVTVDSIQIINAGLDQVLDYQFETTLDADYPRNFETGKWLKISGTGIFSDTTSAKTFVSGLSSGENIFSWNVTNGVCRASSDTVIIIVNDLIIPTMITPNMDGINDFLVIRGLENLGKTELHIFDASGFLLYKTPDYGNDWNGTDKNGKRLPDGTYFYILRSENNLSKTGYIVIRE